ncbi:unnamed protein product [Effrenium voratum]|nr:unnamed protein product [Effrenium voratum]
MARKKKSTSESESESDSAESSSSSKPKKKSSKATKAVATKKASRKEAEEKKSKSKKKAKDDSSEDESEDENDEEEEESDRKSDKKAKRRKSKERRRSRSRDRRRRDDSRGGKRAAVPGYPMPYGMPGYVPVPYGAPPWGPYAAQYAMGRGPPGDYSQTSRALDRDKPRDWRGRDFGAFNGRDDRDRVKWVPGQGRNPDLEAEKLTGAPLARNYSEHDDRRGEGAAAQRGSSPGGKWKNDMFEQMVKD